MLISKLYHLSFNSAGICAQKRWGFRCLNCHWSTYSILTLFWTCNFFKVKLDSHWGYWVIFIRFESTRFQTIIWKDRIFSTLSYLLFSKLLVFFRGLCFTLEKLLLTFGSEPSLHYRWLFVTVFLILFK